MAITDILLRITTHPDLTAKGSELLFAEMDNNLIVIYEALKTLNDGSGLAPYNAGTTYEGTVYVSYNGNIYKHLVASSIGVTPGTDPLTWQLTSAGELVHQQGTDQALDTGGPYQVTANELFINSLNWADLNALAGSFGLNAGRVYHIRDRGIYIMAVSTSEFSRRAVMIAQNANYQTTADFLRESSLVANDAIWGDNTSYWWNQITSGPFPTAGDRIGKMCIYQGKHYTNVAGNNSALTPDADPTNWTVVPNGDASYLYETELIEYDFAADDIRLRADKRGNVIGKPSNIGNVPLTRWFQFGNDRVVDNYAVDGYFDISSNRNIFANNKLRTAAGSNLSFPNWRGDCQANTWIGKGVNGTIISAETNTTNLSGNTFRDCISINATTNFSGYINGCTFDFCNSIDFSEWGGYMNNNVFANFTTTTLTATATGATSLDNSYFENAIWFIDGTTNEGIVIKKDWSNVSAAYLHTPPGLGGTTTLRIPYFAATEVTLLGGPGSFDIEEIDSIPNMLVRIAPAAGESMRLKYSGTQIQSPDGTADDTFVGSSGHFFIGAKMAGGKFHVLQWFN